MIGKDYEYIAPYNINLQDEKVFENFKNGFTAGIFQFESNGMKDTLKKIECSSIDDLIVSNALFRPGSIKYIDNYADRKKGSEEYTFLHEDLSSILKDTYGIIVFQEQLIEIGRLANLQNPDELRKATAKKKAGLLNKIKPELYQGLLKRGWTEKQLDLLWDTMLDFAKYSFNKSHAAAYAIIAYICMYLKTYHPKEFLCAWINSVSDDTEKVAECVKEATRMGIKIHLGKYNNCSPASVVYKDGYEYGIMMGVKTIKFCNERIAEEMLNLPKCETFIELLDNIQSTTIDSKQLKVLISLNFFSDFGKNEYLLKVLDVYNGVKEKKGNKIKTVLPSFRTCSQIKKEKIADYAPWGISEYLIKKYSENETAKQYSGIDNLNLLNELISQIPNQSMSIVEFIKTENEYLEYVTYCNPKISDSFYIVIDYKTYKDATKPTVILHNLRSGDNVDARIKQSIVFKSNPFGLFSILKMDSLTYRFKKKLIDGEWKTSDETECILENYEVIRNE